MNYESSFVLHEIQGCHHTLCLSESPTGEEVLLSLLFIFFEPDLIHSSLMFKLLDLFDEPPIHNFFVVEINGH